MRIRRREDKILDLVKSNSWGWKHEKTRYWILSSRLHQDEKTRYWISFIFSSWWSRLDKIQYLVCSSSHHREVDMMRCMILSSHLLKFSSWWSRLDDKSILSSSLFILMKLTWQDPGSCLLLFLSKSSRLDEIQHLVFSSSLPHEVDLTRSRILSSPLLVKIKSTWRDPASRLLVFSSSWSWLDKIQDLVFLSSRPNQVDLIQYFVFLSSRADEVDLTRSSILSSPRLSFLMKSTWRDLGSCLLVLIKSTWRDLGSRLFVFSSWRSLLDESEDLVLAFSPRLFVFLTPFLVFSSALPDLSRLLGALLSFRR